MFRRTIHVREIYIARVYRLKRVHTCTERILVLFENGFTRKMANSGGQIYARDNVPKLNTNNRADERICTRVRLRIRLLIKRKSLYTVVNRNIYDR